MRKFGNMALTLVLSLVAAFASGGRLHSAHCEHQTLFRDSVFHHGAPAQTAKSTAELTYAAYGFVPYWERSYSCPRWDLVSRIAYFNCSISSDGSITATNHWYDASVIDDALANSTPVDLCIAIFSSATINTVISNASSRAACIHNSIDAMLARGGSGINIDFEHPSAGYGDELVTFCAEFRESLDTHAAEYWLSICLPSVDWSDNYFTDQLKDYCDALFIMGYGYHWGGSPYTGAVDPLDDPAATWDLAYSVNHFISQSDAPGQIILGLPAYGYDWPCSGPDKGASTTGSGSAVFYSTAIVNAETYGRLWDSGATSPWYRYGSWHQCWYSDSASLDARYAYAISRGLMGVGWWALGYDDGDDAFWGAVENRLTGTAGTDTTDTVIVDNGDPGYTSGGTWFEGTYDTLSGWEHNYKYCSAGGALDWANWTPELARSAEYDVYMWWYAGGNRCDSVFVRVVGANDDTFFVSQQGTGAQWHYIGRFYFNAGSGGYVGMHDQNAVGGTVVIADAVMWIYAEELNISQNLPKSHATNLSISPNPFNSSCAIAVDVGSEHTQSTTIEIYDLQGNVVYVPSPDAINHAAHSLIDEKGASSKTNRIREIIWRPNETIPSGIYLVHIFKGKESTMGRVIYLK